MEFPVDINCILYIHCFFFCVCVISGLLFAIDRFQMKTTNQQPFKRQRFDAKKNKLIQYREEVFAPWLE